VLNAIKWIGTACVVAAAACRAFDVHAADIALSIAGGLLWAGVAAKTKDNALFTVNAFIVGILLIGAFR